MPSAPDDTPVDTSDVTPDVNSVDTSGSRKHHATEVPARRVSVEPHGPVLIEGPVEIVLDDGTVARSDRFMAAVCTCRRSRTYPWCDTSHRRRERSDAPTEDRDAR